MIVTRIWMLPKADRALLEKHFSTDPNSGVSFMGPFLIEAIRPDRIFLTPTQRRELLEKITMDEREARLLAIWKGLFG
jgi:hypothetical protein